MHVGEVHDWSQETGGYCPSCSATSIFISQLWDLPESLGHCRCSFLKQIQGFLANKINIFDNSSHFSVLRSWRVYAVPNPTYTMHSTTTTWVNMQTMRNYQAFDCSILHALWNWSNKLNSLQTKTKRAHSGKQCNLHLMWSHKGLKYFYYFLKIILGKRMHEKKMILSTMIGFHAKKSCPNTRVFPWSNQLHLIPAIHRLRVMTYSRHCYPLTWWRLFRYTANTKIGIKEICLTMWWRRTRNWSKLFFNQKLIFKMILGII